MADTRNKAERPGFLENFALSARAQRKLPWLALALLVLAMTLFWLSWRDGANERLRIALKDQRDLVSMEVGQAYRNVKAQLDALAADREVARLLSIDEPEQAAARSRVVLEGALGVDFLPPDLGILLEREPGEIGYGRLALIEQVLHDGGTRATVLRSGGQPTLVVAGRVSDKDRVLAVALVRFPISLLAEPLLARTPPGAFLGIRQGRFTVAHSGPERLAAFAETGAVPVQDTDLRIVAAAPAPIQSPVDPGLLTLAGALVLVLSGVVVILARRAPVESKYASEKTMIEALQEPDPEPQRPVTRLAETPRPGSVATPRPTSLERSIFRAYDIRGVVGQTLDADIARLLGMAIGSAMHEQGLREIVVGRDGRESGVMLVQALIEGLRAAGRDVIDIGLAATPMVYFAAFKLHTGCCVAVTGSHNPPEYNGFKIVIGGQTLSGDAIQALYAAIAHDRLHRAGALGGLQNRDVKQDYVERIAGDIQVERPLKVVVDCGNGVAGDVAPDVLEAIGCEVVPLFCEVDGSFPNHHPDPSDPDNLRDLVGMVERMGADLGLAFDGDGDRLGVVARGGEIVYPDRILMLFAQDVLARNPGACILYDVKCTGRLAGHILRHGGSPVMWKTGHSLMKAKMKETEAELAGEMSGHFFFKERWYGFDDGIYAAARLLEILAASGVEPEDLFAELPKGVDTPELKMAMPEGEQHPIIARLQEAARFEGARVSTIDGVRADWPDGWGLARASNTTPALIFRFEADDETALQRIQGEFRTALLALNGKLTLPF